ncbi:MAG: hypothetical protein AVDCRST_MAG86-825, partial [uncultured Truepera sp.]
GQAPAGEAVTGRHRLAARRIRNLAPGVCEPEVCLCGAAGRPTCSQDLVVPQKL